MPPPLDAEGRRFIYRPAYNEMRYPPSPGFFWDGTEHYWYTMDPRAAVKLRAGATSDAENLLKRSFIDKAPWTLPLSLPRQLLPHQIEAVRFALGQSRSYLGLDPGLGKTLCAALVAQALKLPTVYVTPPSLVENIKEEFRKWAPRLQTTVWADRLAVTAPTVFIVPDTMLALKDDVAERIAQWARKRPALLIVDEAHRFKNEKTKRTPPVLDVLLPAFTRVVFMSGTPMPNRPMELYPLLSKAAPETIDFMSQKTFGQRFCNGYLKHVGGREVTDRRTGKTKHVGGKKVWDFTGRSNMPELRQRVYGTFMLRQKMELLNLPPKLEEVFIVSDTMPIRLARLDAQVLDAYGTEGDTTKALVTVLGQEHTATYRRMLGLHKVKAAAEYIKSVLEETSECLLVFAYHKEVISGLTKALEHYVPLVIDGSVPPARRHAIVNEFQNPKTNARVLIANYTTMVGFTLTKATREIFVEFDWVPGVNDQASGRAHRIGQTKTVLVQYMVFKDSLDKRVIEVLLNKRESINCI